MPCNNLFQLTRLLVTCLAYATHAPGIRRAIEQQRYVGRTLLQFLLGRRKNFQWCKRKIISVPWLLNAFVIALFWVSVPASAANPVFQYLLSTPLTLMDAGVARIESKLRNLTMKNEIRPSGLGAFHVESHRAVAQGT